MIRTAFSRAPDGTKIGNGCLKSFVGTFLKHAYPMCFPDREVVKGFLAFAIERGIVVESGEREYKLLTLPGTAPGSTSSILESSLPPIPVALMPKRALEVASVTPFVIFIPWAQCPSKSVLPKGTFVQSYEYVAILMYASKLAALSAVEECPPLRRGTLVDWRRVSTQNVVGPIGCTKLEHGTCPVVSPIAVEEWTNCSVCATSQLKTEVYKSERGVVCDSCYEFSEEDAAKAGKRVGDLLQLMAENDDICVNENIIRTLLAGKHSEDCASKKQAALWITSAVNEGVAALVKRDKNKCVCLPIIAKQIFLSHQTVWTLPQKKPTSWTSCGSHMVGGWGGPWLPRASQPSLIVCPRHTCGTRCF
jgi:hypothetical protein